MHHSKSSYHLLPYKVITVLLTVFLVLTYLFLTESFYLLISLNYFFPLPTPLPFGNYFFSVSLTLFLFGFVCSFLSFRFHIEVKSHSIFISLTYLLRIICSRPIHVVTKDFFLCLSTAPFCMCVSVCMYISSLSIHLLMGT